MRKAPNSDALLHRSRGGFTLLELMVVLILISLFSAVIVPSVVTASREDTASTQRDKVAELLRFAYLSAVTRHSPVKVYLDGDRGVCRVVAANTALPWREEEPSAEMLASLRLPKGMRIDVQRGEEGVEPESAGDGGVTFYSDGRADGVTITLSDGRGQPCALELVGATGEIRVLDAES